MNLVKLSLSAIFLFSCVQENQGNKSPNDQMAFTKKYIKIDEEIISKRDPWEVIEPLWWTVNIYESQKEYEKDLAPFTIHQRAVFAILWYMSEVNNGGHLQFYTNSTGIVWKDALEGFELVGIQKAKQIIEESAESFGAAPSPDRSVRETILGKNGTDFDDLDSRFYQLEEEMNLDELLADFIEKNKDKFYFEGEVLIPD